MKRVLLLILCLAAQPLWAAALETELADIQHRWAEIQYQVPEDLKEKAFEGLASALHLSRSFSRAATCRAPPGTGSQ